MKRYNEMLHNHSTKKKNEQRRRGEKAKLDWHISPSSLFCFHLVLWWNSTKNLRSTMTCKALSCEGQKKGSPSPSELKLKYDGRGDLGFQTGWEESCAIRRIYLNDKGFHGEVLGGVIFGDFSWSARIWSRKHICGLFLLSDIRTLTSFDCLMEFLPKGKSFRIRNHPLEQQHVIIQMHLWCIVFPMLFRWLDGGFFCLRKALLL